MAKQKNPLEAQLPEEAENFQHSDLSAHPSEPQQEVVLSAQKRQEKPSEEKPDSFILGILQSFAENDALYVDRHGGTFTSDTPAAIRGNSVLYQNPFYKSKNK